MPTHVVTDLDQCRRLWRTHVRPRFISDLWEYRACFHSHYRHPPHFLVMEDSRGVAGLLPLSYVPEIDTFAYFPGEIWNGKTWSERNPMYLREPGRLPDLLDACPDRTYLRYLELPPGDLAPGVEVDELGYVLYPLDLGCDESRYRDRFSRKRLKEINRTISSLLTRDHSFHVNRLEDFDLLVEMNIGRFGAQSYLYDARFRESMRDLTRMLSETGRLRMLSVDIEGATAAVDLGAVHHSVYTVFLGGTHPGFLGVSKVMNMHHIDFAFEQRMQKVDFLCGDFHWKKLWHLDPEPLYRYTGPAFRSVDPMAPPAREAFIEA